MKTDKLRQPPSSLAIAAPSATNRRGLLAGAAAVGAAVVAAKALPGTPAAAASTATAAVEKVAPDTSGGYRLTPHVRRYYETTHA